MNTFYWYWMVWYYLLVPVETPQALKNPFQVQRGACCRRPVWRPDPFCLLLLLLFAVQEERGEEEETRGTFREKKFWGEAESSPIWRLESSPISPVWGLEPSTISPIWRLEPSPISPIWGVEPSTISISGLQKPFPDTSAGGSSSFLCRSCRI